MLESMIKNPRPTRAETTDVANAIYDGTSAIMLSGETAAGAYPVEAVRTMVRIAESTEENINYVKRFRSDEYEMDANITNAIAHACVTTSIDLHARAILTVTVGGNTAKLLSKFRPVTTIIGCTPKEITWRQLSLSWGVIPVMVEERDSNTEDLLHHAVIRAEEEKILENGDLVVITAGVPLGISGTTNLMKVHVVGDVLTRGLGVTDHIVTAPVYVANDAESALKHFVKDSILVIRETTNEIISVMKSAKGIITEEGTLDSHAAIVGLSLDIPVIVGASNAVKIIKSGTTIVMDSGKGLVSVSS
jgi:pyruvate kinase